MTFPLSPDDRPDPNEQHAVRARVPDHVARGVFSTGVIVMTAPTEFVIDFIQNLGRPHQVVARVVMPHPCCRSSSMPAEEHRTLSWTLWQSASTEPEWHDDHQRIGHGPSA